MGSGHSPGRATRRQEPPCAAAEGRRACHRAICDMAGSRETDDSASAGVISAARLPVRERRCEEGPEILAACLHPETFEDLRSTHRDSVIRLDADLKQHAF